VVGRETATPCYFHLGSFTMRPHVDGDALHQQPNDLSAVGGARLWRMPQTRNVPGQRLDAGLFVLTELSGLILQKAIVFLLQSTLRPQRFFPAALQASRHQTILGLHRVILPLSTLRLLGRPFQTLFPMVVEPFPFLMNILHRL
jgi:hypothetical protein